MKTFQGETAIVTGASGFFGQYLVKALAAADAKVVELNSNKWDMMETPTRWYIKKLFKAASYVFHLAGYNGGIGFNMQNPADIFVENTIMGLHLLDLCAECDVGKVVSVVASCGYPDDPIFHGTFGDSYLSGCHNGVLGEKLFLSGEPNASVACHGYAKRNLQLASRFYRQQYDLHAVTACLTTLYGPGLDCSPERSKVMGGLIGKFVKAQQERAPSVTLWGTGGPLREFIHVEDAARDLLVASQLYDDSDYPLNVGCGTEVSIKALAEKVSAAVGYEGEIVWDDSMPDGQYRKKLDTTKWEALAPNLIYAKLDEGIRETVRWYKESME